MAKKNFKFDGLVQTAEKQRKQSAEQIKSHIKIEQEFRALIPPLAEEEFAQLEENIRQEGCRDALIVWQQGEDYILIDGHNRHNICTHHKLDFKVQIMDFADRAEAKDWMIRNQLGRRNLTPEQQSYLRGKRYENEKGQRGGDRKTTRQSKAQNEPLTAERLASEYGVGRETIKRDEKFAIGIDRIGEGSPDLKRRILAGETRFKKSDIQKVADLPEEAPLIRSEVELTRTLRGGKQKKRPHKSPEKSTDAKTAQFAKMRDKIVYLLHKGEREQSMETFREVETLVAQYAELALRKN